MNKSLRDMIYKGIDDDTLQNIEQLCKEDDNTVRFFLAYFYFTGSNKHRLDKLNITAAYEYIYTVFSQVANNEATIHLFMSLIDKLFAGTILEQENKIVELETKIKEQADKLEELELTPPLEGGIEYRRAKMRFERGSTPTTPAIPFV